MRRLAALITSLLLASGCTPFQMEWRPPAKKCQVWVKVDNGDWHCYERGEVNEILRRL